MAKMKDVDKEAQQRANSLWKGVTEQDFYNETNIIDEDIQSHDKKAMILFSQNVNLMRHLPRLTDGLKIVERRILYSMYLTNCIPGNKPHKSSKSIADTMAFHAHGDISIYKTYVGMAQAWKTPYPLIQGKGNYGNDEASTDFADMRYTEGFLTKYATDCFFKDHDEDCIEKIFNTSIDGYEPMALSSRYPNGLLAGGFGIALGNAYCIPPYNAKDIVDLCHHLIDDPNYPDIYINPTSPTGCDIVDNGTLREICDTGNGVWRMRSRIEIDGSKPNVWILKVKNLPWMVSIASVEAKLVKLAKDGVLPIKDIQNNSYSTIEKVDGYSRNRMIIDYHIIINRAHDPNIMKQKLYKLTELEKSLSVNFKVVSDALSVDRLNMRDILLAWLDTRREYKRRLMNKRIAKLNANISLLEVLLNLTEADNLPKTINVVQHTKLVDLPQALIHHAHMNSYQAKQIADMKLSAFTEDAHDNYYTKLQSAKSDLAELMEVVKSPKKINAEIKEELKGLLKYTAPPRSEIVAMETNVKVTNTDHFLVITSQGMMKKLPYDKNQVKKNTPAIGVFKQNDYPVQGFVINNHDSVMLFDSFGKYSVIPMHDVENTEASQYGSRVFDNAKLEGNIVTGFPYFTQDTKNFIKDKLGSDVFMVTLTKNGYLKKSPLDEFITSRSTKNAISMKVRGDDSLIFAMPLLEHVSLLVYTEKGHYTYITADDIAIQSKNSMGLLSMTLDPSDACVGVCVIGADDEYLVVVTEKGNTKKCELSSFGEAGKRKLSSYLATLDANDKIIYVNSAKEDQTMVICTRTAYVDLRIEDIPVKPRKAKGQKLIAIPLGNNIISITIQ